MFVCFFILFSEVQLSWYINILKQLLIRKKVQILYRSLSWDVYFWHSLKSWLYLNCAIAALHYLLQIKRNQGPSLECTFPFNVAKYYIISCLFHEIKLWPLNWLILESKSYTETFSSVSQVFVWTDSCSVFCKYCSKMKKMKWAWFSKSYLTSPTELHGDFQMAWVCVIWPCIGYTKKKKEEKKKWNNVKSKLVLQLEAFSAVAEIKYCQENKKHAWTVYISAKATIYHSSDEQPFKISICQLSCVPLKRGKKPTLTETEVFVLATSQLFMFDL